MILYTINHYLFREKGEKYTEEYSGKILQTRKIILCFFTILFICEWITLSILLLPLFILSIISNRFNLHILQLQPPSI